MYSDVFLNALSEELMKIADYGEDAATEEEMDNDPDLKGYNYLSPTAMTLGAGAGMIGLPHLLSYLPLRAVRKSLSEPNLKRSPRIAAMLAGAAAGGYAGKKLAEGMGAVAPKTTAAIGGAIHGGLAARGLAGIAELFTRRMTGKRLPPALVNAITTGGAAYGLARGAKKS